MLVNSCSHLVKRVIALVGLASLSASIALPAAAEIQPSSSNLNNLSNSQTQSLPDRISPDANLVAQATRGLRNNVAVQLETDNDAFSILGTLLKATGLNTTLAQRGPYTVFAPTDEAFAKLPEGTLRTLLLPENNDKLVKLLTYHVVPRRVTSTGVTSGNVRTLAGQPVRVQVARNRSQVKVNGANVILTDIPATNGVIHGIDSVLMPPSP